MFNSKFITTLIAIVIAIIAIFNISQTNTLENFLPSRQARVERVMAANPQAAMKGQFFTVPGQYQSMIAPRFSSTSLSSQVSYALPEQKNMAVPKNPLSFGNMVAPSSSEAFTHDSGDSLRSQIRQQEYPDVGDMIPVSDMTTMNALGESSQPIVYDRMIYSNRNSRSRGQGDMIRGDLPIVPRGGELWAPSVHPTIDLQQGAINVMSGSTESTRSMAQLMSIYSDGTSDTQGGVNLRDISNSGNCGNGSGMHAPNNQFRDMSLGAGLSDIIVTSYA